MAQRGGEHSSLSLDPSVGSAEDFDRIASGQLAAMHESGSGPKRRLRDVCYSAALGG
jgi:hypothetical protein